MKMYNKVLTIVGMTQHHGVAETYVTALTLRLLRLLLTRQQRENWKASMGYSTRFYWSGVALFQHHKAAHYRPYA